MNITISEFKDLYPELAGFADAVISKTITLSESEIDEAKWGQFYEPAILCLTAHKLAIKQNKSLQVISQLKSLDESRDMNVGTKNASYYISTVYGQEFLALKKKLPRIGGMFSNN